MTDLKMIQKSLFSLLVILNCLLVVSDPVLANHKVNFRKTKKENSVEQLDFRDIVFLRSDDKYEYELKKEQQFAKPIVYKDLSNLKLTFEFVRAEYILDGHNETAIRLVDDLYDYWCIAYDLAKKHENKKKIKKQDKRLIEERLTVVNSLAPYLISLCSMSEDELPKTQSMLEEAVAVSEKTFPNSLLLADAYHNLANSYVDKKNHFDQVLKYYNRALSLREHYVGKKHFSIAKIYYDIGITYYYFFKRNDQAISYIKKGIDMMLHDITEENYRTVLTAYELLGRVYEEEADYASALEYHTKALNLITGLPDDHKESLTISKYRDLLKSGIQKFQEKLAKQEEVE